MAAADYTSLVQQIYISYFGRPADTLGLANYTSQLNTLHAPTTLAALLSASSTNTALATLVNSFGTSTESVALYGTDTVSFVNSIYSNVLNRAADFDGLVYWSNQINTGAVSKAQAAIAIADGALHNATAQGVIDAAVLANKTTIATNFTAGIDTGAELVAYSGANAAAAARDMLKSVTATTVPATFQATVDTTLTQLVAAAAPVVPTVVTALTTSADNFPGSSGNDTFVATLPFTTGSLDATATLTAGDQLTGGAGTDTLSITISGSTTGATTSTPNTTSVEKVLVSNVSSDAAHTPIIDLSLVDSSLTTVGTASSTTAGVLTQFNNVGQLVGVAMQGAGNLTVNFVGGVTGGVNDTVAVALNGAIGNTTSGAASTLSIAAIENVNFTSAGSAANNVILADTSVKTITITGSQDVTLAQNGVPANLTSIDASAATGGVSIAGDGLALTTTTVKGGSGSGDTFYTDQNVTASSKLANITGFETIGLDSTGTQSVTLDAAVTGVSSFAMSQGGAPTSQTLTFATGYTGATTVDVSGGGGSDSIVNTANIALTLAGRDTDWGVAGAVSVTGGTGTDALIISARNGTANLANDSSIDSVTIKGSSSVPTRSTTITGLNTAATKTATVDASNLGSTATLTFTAGTDSGHLSITGGAGNDTITAGNGGDTVNGGAGADSITMGTGNDVINGGDGNDTIVAGANLTSSDTIDGGAGTDTLNVDSVATNAFAHVTNIENVQFSATATNINLTSALTSAAVTLDLTNAAAQVLTLSSGYTGATTVKIGATGADTVVNNANVALTVTGAVTKFNNAVITGGTATDTLSMTADAGTASLASVTGVETITIGASSSLATGATLTGAIGLAAGKTMTVDASAITDSTAAFNFTAGAAVVNSGLSIVGGAGVDTITWSAAAANATVIGGASADSLTAGTGIDSINGGAGNDTINMGSNLTFDDTVDGGAGTNKLISSTAGTIGAAGEFAHVTNIQTLALTGAGGTVSLSSSSPTFSTIDLTAASAQTVTINPGFTGAVTVKDTANGAGNIDTVTNSGNVALTVNGNIADFTIDVITGGTGVDTLNMTADAAGMAANAAITKVEQINILANTVAATATGTINLAAANVASGKTLTIDASALTNSSATFTLDGHLVASTGSLSIIGGSGNDVITGGAGNDTINGGSGADLIDGKAGNDAITTGAGNDVVVVNANAIKLNFATVTDLAAGDALEFVGTGTASSTVAAQLTLNAAATLSDYLDAAAVAGTGATNSVISWFQFGGNTYVVGDNSNTTSFVAGTDKVIQLNGLYDLSTANITSDPATHTVLLQLGSASAITAVALTPTFTDAAGTVSFVGGGSLANSFTVDTAAHLGTDTIAGGTLVDTLTLTGSGGADANFAHVTSVENLVLGGANTATIGVNAQAAGIVNVSDTTGAITLTASAYTTGLTVTATGANQLAYTAGSGADNITGSSGVDTLTFGANLTSADTISGLAGTDVLKVSGVVADSAFTHITAVETLDLTGASTGVTLAALSQAAGIVTVTNSGNGGVVVNAGAYTTAISITGGSGVNTITGGTAGDTLGIGSGGGTVTGGLGADTMSGGAGADTFIIATGDNAATTAATADTVLVFTTTVDHLKLGVLGTAAGAFTAVAGTSTNTYAQALAAANVVFAATPTQSYFMTSYGTDGASAQAVLFENMDHNATADGAILIGTANQTASMALATALVVAADIQA